MFLNGIWVLTLPLSDGQPVWLLEVAMSELTQIPTAFIVGATGGVGSALARRLTAAGWSLWLCGRSRPRLDALGEELGADTETVDAADLDALENVFGNAWQKLGRIDGVVNCAGSLILKPAHLTSGEEWIQTLSTNLTTSFNVLRCAASHMMRSNGGSIVLISSAVAGRGMINHDAIAAAKAGVVGLAQSAAATYARYQIRVNCIAPGLTRTPLTEPLTKSDAVLKASVALHPLGRIGKPEEIASGIHWFLEPQQSWVTGQVLAIDGGLGNVQPRPTVT